MAAEGSLGQRLRARRIELGLKLADVAQRAELSIPYVSNLERGRGNPTLDALTAIAGALQTTVRALLGEEGVGPVDVVLGDAPRSLLNFSRTSRFKEIVQRLAAQQGEDYDELRRRILVGMASAPRRSSGDPTEDDWRRLLDAYRSILSE